MTADPIVVLNADDLGISRQVDDEILRLHGCGLITSATLLVNGPTAEEAVERAPGTLGIGVHLDTSQFAPLTRSFARVRSTDPNLDIRTSKRLTPSIARAVGEEWIAQVVKARALGVTPTHVDSHHFDHVNPTLVPQLRRLNREAGITRVRGMHNLWRLPPNRVVQSIKRGHRWALGHAGLTTTSFMCDAGTFVSLGQSKTLPTRCSIEVMVHPGHPSYAEETERLEQASDWVTSLRRVRFDEISSRRSSS